MKEESHPKQGMTGPFCLRTPRPSGLVIIQHPLPQNAKGPCQAYLATMRTSGHYWEGFGERDRGLLGWTAILETIVMLPLGRAGAAWELSARW